MLMKMIRWDTRDGNYCHDSESKKLTLIDIDSLTTYFEEITETPGIWERRKKGRGFALSRLRQMVLRLLSVQDIDRGLQKRDREIWDEDFLPVLKHPGRDIKDEEFAAHHFRFFMKKIENEKQFHSNINQMPALC